MSAERRKHTRLDIEFNIEIRMPDGGLFKGKTKNISFGGILLDLPEKPASSPGDICHVEIILHDDGVRRIDIKLDCEVKRSQEGELGLQFMEFVGLDLESYVHFKNLMVLNSEDPEELIAELEEYPGAFLNVLT